MTSNANPSEPSEADETEVVEHIAEDVRDEIRHGHVEDDVAHVLEDRLDKAGVHLRPEAIDDLAEDIETDASI
ncbi:hypothetical protein F6B41_30000 [Microbacterium lushaniae]|nr:hypothetical protein F6B41_32550 [Microbacterium lushaniae]KAA9147432.1 hypothetical protein F6B41_30000 [Microbacterium lushaniae]